MRPGESRGASAAAEPSLDLPQLHFFLLVAIRSFPACVGDRCLVSIGGRPGRMPAAWHAACRRCAPFLLPFPRRWLALQALLLPPPPPPPPQTLLPAAASATLRLAPSSVKPHLPPRPTAPHPSPDPDVTYPKGGMALGLGPPYPLILWVGGFAVGPASYASTAARLASWGCAAAGHYGGGEGGVAEGRARARAGLGARKGGQRGDCSASRSCRQGAHSAAPPPRPRPPPGNHAPPPPTVAPHFLLPQTTPINRHRKPP